mgnify:CR=1 FL=1
MEYIRTAIPEVILMKPIVFGDHRGFFLETFRQSEFDAFCGHQDFVQDNHSGSRQGILRGLHYQLHQTQGKLVRAAVGEVFDVAVDIRQGSPTFGKWVGAVLSAENRHQLWVPPGFAHGILLIEDSLVEYFCTGEYNPECEAGISPFSDDIDWSICGEQLKNKFDDIAPGTEFISDKDKNGLSLKDWLNDRRSDNFIFKEFLT